MAGGRSGVAARPAGAANTSPAAGVPRGRQRDRERRGHLARPGRREVLAVLNRRHGGFPAGRRQHPAGQRPLRARISASAWSRHSAPPSGHATGRFSAELREQFGLADYLGSLQAVSRPGSTTIRELLAMSEFLLEYPFAATAVPAGARGRGAPAHARPAGGAVGRRHRISAAQDPAIRASGMRSRAAS